jgi:2-oxoglutarate ferredoxin oxidoreductase subunit alpha
MLKTQPVPAEATAGAPSVNKLTIQVATVNGSGSQTSNNTLLRALFQMGIPVSGKNLFPSNIAGLPTWFTIRADADGYIARRREVDVLVCMNSATADADIAGVPPGAFVLVDDTIRLARSRSDLTVVPVPFQALVKEVCPAVALRKLVVNMIYAGVLAEALGIEVPEVERALRKAFATKPKALTVNLDAVHAGVRWAKEHLTTRPRHRVARMDRNAGKILVDGNTACAVGALFAGATVVTWYPITPSSSLAETFTDLAQKYRVDPATGRSTCAIVQAEDEIAAIGMVIGAGWAGARAMTATSGPGISLMAEFAGLSYYAEVPGVIFDVQRTGPSTGLPTRTMQGDVLKAAFLSHGDAMHPCLYPCDIAEAYAFAIEAFDLAERLQTMVFVLTDLDLGMNLWMSDPFPYPEEGQDRGKVLTAEDLKARAEAAKADPSRAWGRYKDLDGDAIPYRTLPGTPGGLGAYFTRGSGHDEYARYSEDGDAFARNMRRLARKLDTARGLLPGPEVHAARGGSAKVGLLAYGTTHHALLESRDQLRSEQGLDASYLRVRGFPFDPSIGAWIAAHERVYCVEQNRDAQMARMLRMEYPALAGRIRSVLHFTGLPIDARTITEQVTAQERASREVSS